MNTLDDYGGDTALDMLKTITYRFNGHWLASTAEQCLRSQATPPP
jgi:hypothetical protein